MSEMREDLKARQIALVRAARGDIPHHEAADLLGCSFYTVYRLDHEGKSFKPITQAGVEMLERLILMRLSDDDDWADVMDSLIKWMDGLYGEERVNAMLETHYRGGVTTDCVARAWRRFALDLVTEHRRDVGLAA